MFYQYMPAFQQVNDLMGVTNKPSTMKKKRHIFTAEEDEKLKQLVQQKGCYKWEEIASEMEGLNPRQCKDRWTNFLNPKIVSKPWTPEEEIRLLQLVRSFGNCWVQIARRFNGRTDVQIKNKYNSLMQKLDINKTAFQMMHHFYPMNYQTVPQQHAQQQSPPCSEPEPSNSTSPSVDFIDSLNCIQTTKDEESIFGLDFDEAFKLFA